MPRSTNGRTTSTRPSTIFERGDIVRVLFPHVERAIVVPRPALVISAVPVGPDASLIWTLMITNRAREPWPGDIPIEAAERLGLIIPSKIRTAKVTTSEVATTSRLGRLDHATLAQVMKLVSAICG